MQEPKVIYADKDFLAVDKPAGLLVHGSRSTDHGLKSHKPRIASCELRTMNHEHTLVDWLLERYPEIRNVGDDPKTRPGIVHRLDRDTSGVMLVARNQKYFEYLKSLFKKGEIKKTYLALVSGVPKEKRGIVDRPLGIKSGTTKRSVYSEKMAKSAVTEYRVLKVVELPQSSALGKRKSVSLLEVYPRTGRTHQIRVHLASIGHPVVGDQLYGPRQILNPKSKSEILNNRLMLHALALEFTTDEGRRIRVEAEPPSGFSKFL